MRRVVFAIALLLFACAKKTSAPASHTAMLRTDAALDLILGQVLTLPAEDLREYGVDTEGVVSVRAEPPDQPATIMITAENVGATTLFLVDREGHVVRRAVRVGTRTYAPVTPQQELAAELAEVPCTRVAREGDTLVIVGVACPAEERLFLEERRDDYTARHIELRFRDAPPESDAG